MVDTTMSARSDPVGVGWPASPADRRSVAAALADAAMLGDYFTIISGARRQALPAVFQPDHRLAPPGRPLGSQEGDHVRPGHRGRLRAHGLEEHLQVIGHGQPCVGPRPGRHERQVVIQQRMAKRDRLDPAICHRTVKTQHELQLVTPSGQMTDRAERSCHRHEITRI